MVPYVQENITDRLPARAIRGLSVLVSTLVVLSLSSGVQAQVTDNFESYAGSPAGVELNGQGDYYNPLPDASVSFTVQTYAGNDLGVPVNPTGGLQFAAGTGPGGSFFARSQRDIIYGDGTGIWTASFDIAATFVGQLPTAQNTGSFSTQEFNSPPTQADATFIALARWSDETTAANWNADYVWFDSAGTQLLESVADPGFQNLDVNHWYRWSTTFDLDSNLITEVTIKDLTTNITVTNNPVGKYLWGGAAGAPTPTGFRFFAGAADPAGNSLAFDNLSIVPEPAALSLLALGALAAIRRRR